MKNKKYLALYNSVGAKIKELENSRLFAEGSNGGQQDLTISFGVSQSKLPLGDYMWIAAKDEGPAYSVVDLDDDEIPASTVLRYAVERKTYADLASRFHKNDHLKQLRRLSYSSTVTETFLLLEGNVELSASHDTYGSRHNRGIQMEEIDAIIVDCFLGIGECRGSRTLQTLDENGTLALLSAMTCVIRDRLYDDIREDTPRESMCFDDALCGFVLRLCLNCLSSRA